MSTKKQVGTAQEQKASVTVALGVDDAVLWVNAKQNKGRDEKDLVAQLSGGISQNAAIRRLRLIIACLEKEGLPRKPVLDAVAVDHILGQKRVLKAGVQQHRC